MSSRALGGVHDHADLGTAFEQSTGQGEAGRAGADHQYGHDKLLC